MKRILYATTLALTSFATISVTLAGTLLPTTVYAAEEVCEPPTSAAAAGATMQQRIDAMAHCQSSYPVESTTESSHFMQKNTRNPSPTMVSPHNEIDENRLFCPSIPLNASPDDLQYKLALERCKYGA